MNKPNVITFYAKVDDSEVLNVIGTIEYPLDAKPLKEPNEAGARYTAQVPVSRLLRELADDIDRMG